MYIINTTFTLEPSYYEPWFEFLKTEHVPTMESYGFTLPRLHKLHVDGEELTYALQFQSESFDTVKDYLEEIEAAFLEALFNRFGEKILTFTSVLEEVDL